MASYYDVLQVPRTASVAQIDYAYRRAAFEAHPAAPSGDAARFRELTEAFYTLSSTERRAEYDRTQARHGISEEQASRIFDSIAAEWSNWISTFLQSHQKNGSAWLMTGTAGGAALGATVAGPVGFLAGAAVGFVAGMVRVTTNKNLYEHWQGLSAEDRGRSLAQIAELFNRDEQSNGSATGTTGGNAGSDFLSDAEVAALRGSRTGDGEPECKVCLDNAVSVTNHPCQHACLCGPCLASLRLSDTAACPMCRAPIYSVSRVYF